MSEHEELFTKFAEVHAKYSEDKQQWQDEYNAQGEQILVIIRDWEQRLCGHSEKGQYAKFSSKLAEKFWDEIKAYFPLIDFVGVKVTTPASQPAFVVRNLEKEDDDVDPDRKEIDDFDGEDDFVLRKLF